MTRLQRLLHANGGAPVLGAAVYFNDSIFLEIAARVGYQAAWIEMEHAPISFGEAADLCRLSQGLGLLTMIRVPDPPPPLTEPRHGSGAHTFPGHLCLDE